MVLSRNQIVAAHYELFGNFQKKAKFLQLSDGGNYNNLGLYELVRRKCKVIVATDAGCNAETSFADLQALLLRMEQDYGVTIEIRTKIFRERSHDLPMKPSIQNAWSALRLTRRENRQSKLEERERRARRNVVRLFLDGQDGLFQEKH